MERGLVLGEPRVTEDPRDGLAHGGRDLERQIDPQHEIRYVGDEVSHGLQDVLLVDWAMCLEPRFVVVAAQVPQEGE